MAWILLLRIVWKMFFLIYYSILTTDINMTVFIATDSTYIIIVQAVFIILNRAEYMEISTVVSIQTIFGSYPDNTEFILINRRDCGL